VAVAENVAVEDPAGTFTEVGTVNAGLLAETDTLMPPVEAGAERVRVQVEDAPASSVVALHVNADTSTGGIRLKVAVCKVPFKVAVMVALWFVVRAPTEAMNVAELAPTDTVTDAGTVSRVLLSDRETVAPEGADWFKLTVQEVKAPEATVLGLQLNDVGLSGAPVVMVTVPPVAVV